MGSILPDVFLALGFVAHYLEKFTHSAMAAYNVPRKLDR
jgi:hypothetical protein